MNFLVIGYGSIGKRHVERLQRFGHVSSIVDINEEVCRSAKQDFPRSQSGSKLTEISMPSWNETVAVIATWGPSHAEFFHMLADRGVKKILCEKPLAVSLAQASQMVERAKKEGIDLRVNHFMRHLGLIEGLRAAEKKYNLGKPVQILTHGGARCLVTNGIHYVDLANGIFEETPISVISTAVGEKINPRSKELDFYGGTAVWRYAGNREALVSFSNESSLMETMKIYYRNGCIDLLGYFDGVRIHRRDLNRVASAPAITRTDFAEEILFEGKLPEMVSENEARDRLVQEWIGENPTLNSNNGYPSLEGTLGALMAASEERVVLFPIPLSQSGATKTWDVT